MKKYINKAKNIYKNQGLGALSKKAVRFSKTKIIDETLGFNGVFRKLNPEDYALKEEFSFISNKIFDIADDDIKKSKEASVEKLGEIKTINWFIPNFDHLAFGGISTIFRFVEKFNDEGAYTRIIIYDNPSFETAKLKKQIRDRFPKLINYEIIIFDMSVQDVNELPECDVAFCTFWVSAYLLLKFNKTKRKYYFIQDYEPFFYVAGSTFALAESTYRFGFRAIVNTPGLLAAINQRHGTEGISFIPAVNHELYYPDPKRHNDRLRIFFYARPNNPRNAFNLGIATIKHLIDAYGEKIEVITAGSKWDERRYELGGKITNLGLIKSIPEVAELYRSCDIGFAYMLNKHPSYQMLEYTASGVATVMNNNEDHGWIYKDKVNCLLSEPSPLAMAEKIGELIENKRLRDNLVSNAQRELMGYTWEQQTEAVWNDIRKF